MMPASLDEHMCRHLRKEPSNNNTTSLAPGKLEVSVTVSAGLQGCASAGHMKGIRLSDRISERLEC
jgi:hypothetical protein